jgi:hypothetical protein
MEHTPFALMRACRSRREEKNRKPFTLTVLSVLAVPANVGSRLQYHQLHSGELVGLTTDVHYRLTHTKTINNCRRKLANCNSVVVGIVDHFEQSTGTGSPVLSSWGQSYSDCEAIISLASRNYVIMLNRFSVENLTTRVEICSCWI